MNESKTFGILIELAPILGTSSSVVVVGILIFFRRLIHSRFVLLSFLAAAICWLLESILHGLNVHGAPLEFAAAWLCAIASVFFLFGLSAHLFQIQHGSISRLNS
jgi:hypothetical protein